MSEFVHSFYLSFIPFGSIISLIFTFLVGAYLLSIRNRSKATTKLGVSFLVLSFMSIAYAWSFGFYHYSGAYHTLLTNFASMIGVLQLSQFFFYFPNETHPRVARAFMIIQSLIVIAIVGYWIMNTFPGDRVFRIDGLFWDLEKPHIRSITSLIILAYILIIIITGIWRTIITKGKEKWAVLFLMMCFTIVTLGPGVFNVLVRMGTIERIVYYYVYDLVSVVGWFFTVIFYLNFTKDQTSFMAKIVGVTLVTLLVILLWLSYFILNDKEKIYDEFRQKEIAQILLDREYRPLNLEYIQEYSGDTNAFKTLLNANHSSTDFKSSIIEFQNTLLRERIVRMTGDDLPDQLSKLLDDSPVYFFGYKMALMELSREKNLNIELINNKLDTMNKSSFLYLNTIKQMPDVGFRDALIKMLEKQKKDKTMRAVIAAILKSNAADGAQLKSEISKFLVPAYPAGKRIIRKDNVLAKHYIAYTYYNADTDTLYEAGFNFIAYRAYMHKATMVLFYILLVILFIVLICFKFFFSGALVNPLNRLLEGLRKVEQGDLTVAIPVKVEDEIGYLTHNFNAMVSTIHSSKKRIEEYTNNLESMVAARTEELQAAMEELEASNEQVIQTRDALWGEMELAKKIQTVLLPRKPYIEKFEIAAYMAPALEVGGDYYDIINVGSKDWIVIGDVSGHGVPAGLVMMMVQTSIHVTLSQNPNLPPAELLKIINNTITQNIKMMGEDKYMTIIVLACLDGGEFIFAGLHLDIMMYRARTKSVEMIETNGMWIGVMDDIDDMVKDNVFSMTANDVMLLFTDGITEAVRKDSKDSNHYQMYGQERLGTIFKKIGMKSADDILKNLIDSLEDYECDDDVTLVIFKRLH